MSGQFADHAEHLDGYAPLMPDLDAAGEFLDAWAAQTGAPHITLVRILPDTNDCKGQAFRWPHNRDSALRWIAASNVRGNVYFSVNIARPVNKKPLRADIETLVAVHADIDPRKGVDFSEERTRVLALADELAERPDPPTFILDSGGGVQAFYIATDPATAEPEYVDEIEDLNARLEAVLGGKGTWNADRIMRVPGTINHPNQRKIAYGQLPGLARLLSTGLHYSWRDILAAIVRLEDMPPGHATPGAPANRSKGNGHDGPDFGGELPNYATYAELDALFVEFPHLAAVWDKSTCNPPIDDSPSGWDQRWASALAHEGVDRERIASFLRTYREHHEPEKGKQDRTDYIWRTVARATRHRADEAGEPHPAEELIGRAQRQNGAHKANGHASEDGQQQTAGDSQGKNRGTFHTGAQPGSDWPEPGRIGDAPRAPAFPVDLLPQRLGRWIDIQAANMGVTPCVLAVPALVAIAGAIGKDAVLQVKRNDPSWTERPCLWGAVIMPKGSLKSPAIRAATAPLRMAEARARERWQEKIMAWEARQERTKSGQIKPNPRDPRPAEPKLVMTDATIEAMADAMAKSRGLTLIRDELSGLVANMSRYNKGSDRPFLLECHAGGPYAVDRIIRGRQIVPDVYLSIVGGIQPKVARRAFSASAGGEDDGFLERFGLISFPELIPWSGVKDVAPERDWKRLVADAVLSLSQKSWTEQLGEAGFFRLHQQAQPRFFEWLDGHMRERVRAPGADDRADHGFMSKGQGLVLRLAITLHLFRYACGEGVPMAWVELDSLEDAIGIFERFCVPTYMRVCAAFGEVAAFEGAKRIANLIVRRKLDKIRVADVTKLQWQGLREREPILAAFAALEDVDWLRRMITTTSGRGGRPSDHWLVNPKVHQAAKHAE